VVGAPSLIPSSGPRTKVTAVVCLSHAQCHRIAQAALPCQEPSASSWLPRAAPGNISTTNSRPIGRVGLMSLLGRCDKNRYPRSTPVAWCPFRLAPWPLLYLGPRGESSSMTSARNPSLRRCFMKVQQAVRLFQQFQVTHLRPNTVKSYAPVLKKFGSVRAAGDRMPF
jgi:hypothetical protein